MLKGIHIITYYHFGGTNSLYDHTLTNFNQTYLNPMHEEHNTYIGNKYYEWAGIELQISGIGGSRRSLIVLQRFVQSPQN